VNFQACLFSLASIAALIIGTSQGSSGQAPPLRASGVIALPGVKGRIDHLGFDGGTQRLFVAALGNDTVEVLETTKGVHLRSLPGFHEPQGVAILPDVNGVAIANGATGTLQLLDAQTLQTRWTTPVGGDADNVRYDAAAKRLFVAAEGGIFAVDPATGKVVSRIAIDGHPESFQLDTAGGRLFANLPGASRVIEADRRSMSVARRWETGACGANYPMALDESGRRLFVGCRRPAIVTTFDLERGAPLATTPAVGDTDDLFYDAERNRLYVIGGQGAVDVFARDRDQLRSLARIPTRDGARTGRWVPTQRRLYVAAPARGGQSAEIRIFEAER
jgi:hypothetical protein